MPETGASRPICRSSRDGLRDLDVARAAADLDPAHRPELDAVVFGSEHASPLHSELLAAEDDRRGEASDIVDRNYAVDDVDQARSVHGDAGGGELEHRARDIDAAGRAARRG
jgi:hypothetical protein